MHHEDVITKDTSRACLRLIWINFRRERHLLRIPRQWQGCIASHLHIRESFAPRRSSPRVVARFSAPAGRQTLRVFSAARVPRSFSIFFSAVYTIPCVCRLVRDVVRRERRWSDGVRSPRARELHRKFGSSAQHFRAVGRARRAGRDPESSSPVIKDRSSNTGSYSIGPRKPQASLIRMSHRRMYRGAATRSCSSSWFYVPSARPRTVHGTH